MTTNPMMYRVFLLDESPHPENHFRIRSGEKLAWNHTDGNHIPTIESQLSAMNFGQQVYPSDNQVDGHFLINYDSSVIGIVHSIEEIPDRAYELAKRAALCLRDYLTTKTGNPYEFIDVTSRGDKKLAEKLSRKIVDVQIPEYTGRY